MAAPQKIRVLVVDDHALFRKGLVGLLAGERDFEVAGEGANGREALEQARRLRPDIILMDIAMPEMNGLEATWRIRRAMPDVRIVILTVSDDDQDLFEAIRRGALGFLPKKIQPQALFSALRGLMRGEASLSRLMAARVLEEFARQAGTASPLLPPDRALSPREHEVLELVAHGRSNKEIAAALDIAENTVKNHLKRILEKLHLENRVQAAAFALREGLVGPPRAASHGNEGGLQGRPRVTGDTE